MTSIEIGGSSDFLHAHVNNSFLYASQTKTYTQNFNWNKTRDMAKKIYSDQKIVEEAAVMIGGL